MAKKDFQSITNPALAFITPEAPAPELQPIKEKPRAKASSTIATLKHNPAKVELNRYGQESKTKRLNLVVKPSIYKDLENIVKKQKAGGNPYASINGLINDLIEEYLNANK